VAATARVVRRLQGARAAGSPRLLVAADQEGGLVQVLSGPGFSAIPRAIDRRAWGAVRARSAARRWGAQLRRAGVTMDLAPVLDTVPGPAAARRNRPIGRYGRQLGYRPSVVAAHGAAVLRGLADARVAATVKHFPGLGRVAANTDTAAGVTDTRTGPRDAYLRPFRRAVRVGVPAVMVSTARYRRIDPARPAAFSPVVVERLLRHRLGFGGVVVSDDLADARQVAAWPPARRAVRFLRAGGDLVLVADPGVVPSMWRAVLDRARRHPAFRARVDAAALRVLRLKERHGLL
jgi:beta-N-acetylhexosaminidase